MAKVANNLELSSLAGGAIEEQFAHELGTVLANIADPNTDPKTARTLTIKLTFKPDEERHIASVGIETRSILAPRKGTQTKIMIDRDRTGSVVAAELRPRQDGPTLVESVPNTAVGFNKIQGGK